MSCCLCHKRIYTADEGVGPRFGSRIYWCGFGLKVDSVFALECVQTARIWLSVLTFSPCHKEREGGKERKREGKRERGGREMVTGSCISNWNHTEKARERDEIQSSDVPTE